MPELKLQSVDQPAVSTVIADQIRDAIGDGSLLPGQPLSESALAVQLKVSRGPVREAIQRLVQEGLVDRVRNKGVSVADVSHTDVAEIYEARETLESRCGIKLIEAGDPQLSETVTMLGNLVSKMRKTKGPKTPGEVMTLDLSFHETLVTSSGNSRIERAHSTLMVESALCIHRLDQWHSNVDSLIEEHDAIVAAIAQKDRRAFREALHRHYVLSFSAVQPPVVP